MRALHQRSLCPGLPRRSLQAVPCGFLLLCMLLAFAACTTSPATPASNQHGGENHILPTLSKASFDPCTLFSKEDASQVLTKNVSVLPDISSSLCTYTTTPSTSNHSEILVAVGRSDNAPGYFALDRSLVPSLAAMQDLHGIGDAAFTVKLSVGKAIVVLKKPVIYSITLLYSSLNESAMQNALHKLATAAENAITNVAPPLPVPTVQPCSLVSPSEAQHALQNKPVQWLFTANDAGISSCDYLSSLGARNRILVVTDSSSSAKNLFATDMAQTASKKTLTKLGDSSFYDGYDTIWVLKGNTFFHITVLGTTHQEALTEQLARTAVLRF